MQLFNLQQHVQPKKCNIDTQSFLAFALNGVHAKFVVCNFKHKIIIFISALKNDTAKTLTWTTLLFTDCLIPLSWLIYSVYSAAVTQSVDSHWLLHSSLNHQPRSTKNCLHSTNISNRMNESAQSGLSVWSLCFNNLLNGFSVCLHITPPPLCLYVSASSGASEGRTSTFARHQRHRLH